MSRAPLRSEVAERLRMVLEDETQREQVSAWAQEWILEPDPDTSDRAVWRALVRLVGVGMRVSGGGYRETRDTVRAWLKDLETSPTE